MLESLALALAGAGPGAGLAGCATASDDDVTYPEDDTPGSQIRIHEGSEAPQLEAAVSQTPGMVPARTRRGRLVDGARFAYVKATEGTSYTNPEFAQQYNSS